MNPFALDISPQADWSFGLEFSDAYWNGLDGNAFAVLFVVALVAFGYSLIKAWKKRRGMRRDE